MKIFSVLTWNLNSRTNSLVINKQIELIKTNSPDIVTLQEITINSVQKITAELKQIGYQYIVNSFDLCNDISILKGKRKYGQIIASRMELNPCKPNNFKIPFIERILSVEVILNDKKTIIHTTHAPPGSTNGVIKINHFRGIYDYFQANKDAIHILSGDFNTPKCEHEELGMISWGQTITNSGEVVFSREKESDECTAEEWDDAERKIILGLPEIGIKDVFRELYSYNTQEYSWILKRKGEIISKRRYDHIFASTDFNYISADYIHSPLETKISDHSAFIVSLEI